MYKAKRYSGARKAYYANSSTRRFARAARRHGGNEHGYWRLTAGKPKFVYPANYGRW